jgi:3-oxoacyl-[acyl-carrier protein] reductase
MMDLGLKGRTALVLGGSAGLGLGCAEALAAEGARIAILARDPAKLNAAV